MGTAHWLFVGAVDFRSTHNMPEPTDFSYPIAADPEGATADARTDDEFFIL